MKLHLLRHAKTDQHSITGKDFDRKLLSKGINQSNEMGKYFQNIEFQPSIIFCSPAIRTRETLKLIQKQHKFENSINYLDSLYLLELKELFQFVTEIEEKEEILIIAHNNGLSDLASYLTEENIDLSTCDFISIEFDLNLWNEISKGLGKIINRFHPSV